MAQKKITDLSLRSDFDTTCNLPVDDPTQTYRVTGAQILTFIKSLTSKSNEITNLSLVTSVGASALTIAVKTQAGNNASSTDPINVAMRSSTLASGAYLNRSLTSSLSLVVSSGSTLGQADAQAAVIYVYLIDNAGTLELAVSRKLFSEDTLVSTTAEGGAGAADSGTVMYSTAARSTVACRLIGYILNTQSTAGTWASAGTQVQLLPTQVKTPPTIQKFTSGTGTYNTPAGVSYLLVTIVGGGGGGAGGSNSSTNGGAGGTGGTSTFGTSLLTCVGGTGGSANSGPPGTGGSPTIGSGATGSSLVGGGGQGSGASTVAQGGHGGSNPLGGAGSGGGQAFGAGAAASNTGGGGGGASGENSGGGGGAGAFICAIVSPVNATYAYAVGAAGTAGVAGTSGPAGAAGGSGYIEVIEYYQ